MEVTIQEWKGEKLLIKIYILILVHFCFTAHGQGLIMSILTWKYEEVSIKGLHNIFKYFKNMKYVLILSHLK